MTPRSSTMALCPARNRLPSCDPVASAAAIEQAWRPTRPHDKSTSSQSGEALWQTLPLCKCTTQGHHTEPRGGRQQDRQNGAPLSPQTAPLCIRAARAGSYMRDKPVGKNRGAGRVVPNAPICLKSPMISMPKTGDLVASRSPESARRRLTPRQNSPRGLVVSSLGPHGLGAVLRCRRLGRELISFFGSACPAQNGRSVPIVSPQRPHESAESI